MLGVVAVAAGGCQPATLPAPGGPDAPPASATAEGGRRAPADVRGESFPVDAAAQPAVDAAVAAFAASAGVAAETVRVVAVEPVSWPDSALGCPEPEMSYLQVITPGYRVVLEAGEERATYHTSDGSAGPVRAVRCGGDARRQLNLASLSAPALDLARRDLVARLGGEPAIDLLQSTVAPVTQLICPGTPAADDPSRPAMVVFEFQLQSGADIHLYRAVGDKILYCGPYDPPKVDAAGNPTE